MMHPSFQSNVSGGFLQHDARNTLPHAGILPVNPPEQHHLCSAAQNMPDLASSNTTTHTTQLSDSGLNFSYTPISSSSSMALFQNENAVTQVTAATDSWERGAYHYLGTDGRELSLPPKLDERPIAYPMNGDVVAYKKPTSPSSVGKINDYPNLTSTGTRTHTFKSLDEEQFGSSCLSQRKRLLLEARSRARGWPCSICYQRFKRKDYIKQHVKKKHPEHHDGLICTLNPTPERPEAVPASSRSTDDDLLASALLEGEQNQYPMAFWDAHLDNQATESFQFNEEFPGGITTPKKISLGLDSPDGRDSLDGSESRSLSCLKTSHDNSTRTFACPFFKHCPLQHRKCLALSLRRPKDVKQHIYRSHTQPEISSSMSFHDFQTATERDADSDILCDRGDNSVPVNCEGITEDQRRMLNEKLPRDLGVEDQWFQIYAIIFPFSEAPRSPYVGNWLEEIVPLLREKWEKQGLEITARAAGNLNHRQLSSAMDLFFRSLEGEVFRHETVDNPICAATAPSHMWDDIQRDIWSMFFTQPGC